MSATALDRPTTTPLPLLKNGNRLAHLAPAALALAMSLAFSWRPSLWRDETASVSAATRPLPALARMLANVDAVHGLYYLLLHPFASVSLAEWWLRLPSALAVAGTALLLVVLGRQLADLRTGVVAATLWALLPISSRYGQEARSTALGVLLTVAATVVLVEALRRRSSRWWVLYGALLAIGGYVFLFSLLVVAGHAVLVLVTRQDTRRAVRAFSFALAGAAVAVSPLVLVSQTELAGQLDWATAAPTLRDVPNLAWSLWFANRRLSALMYVLVVAGTIAALRSRSGARAVLLVTGLVVAGLPTVMLLTISHFRPVFAYRYVASGATFICLLAAYGVTRVRGRLAVAAVAVVLSGVTVLALPNWHADRTRGGHRDNVREAAAVIQAFRQPGDAVVWFPTLLRTDAVAYPAGFDGLNDVSLAVSPEASGTLRGIDLPTAVVSARLKQVRRVWVVRLGSQGDITSSRQLLDSAGFRVTRTWLENDTTIELVSRP